MPEKAASLVPASSLPIGVFDSGLGGLTIVKALREVMPDEQIIYVGDTAHLPYGDKSPEMVAEHSCRIAAFLLRQPVKAIVIACNTASAAAAMQVRTLAGDVPVYDVIAPAVATALSATQNGRIGVIATKTTIQSGVYRRQLLAHNSALAIVDKATPLLVPMIEEGWLNNAVSQDVIDAYMSDTGFRYIDTLILGCTHYPLIKHQIARYFETAFEHPISVIDSSQAVAKYVQARLAALSLLQTVRKPALDKFYLSDVTAHFQASAAMFLGEKVDFEKLIP